MAGIEVVVRPSVFPDIRPQAKESRAPADPDSGRTVLTGSDALVLDLNLTFTQSLTRQVAREEKRIFDIARIYKTTPDPDNPSAPPSIDKNTYLDVEMPHAIRLKTSRNGPNIDRYYRKPKPEDYPNGNVEILEEDIERKNPRE